MALKRIRMVVGILIDDKLPLMKNLSVNLLSGQGKGGRYVIKRTTQISQGNV
jgi:hypothetical protein